MENIKSLKKLIKPVLAIVALYLVTVLINIGFYYLDLNQNVCEALNLGLLKWLHVPYLLFSPIIIPASASIYLLKFFDKNSDLKKYKYLSITLVAGAGVLALCSLPYIGKEIADSLPPLYLDVYGCSLE